MFHFFLPKLSNLRMRYCSQSGSIMRYGVLLPATTVSGLSYGHILRKYSGPRSAVTRPLLMPK